MLGVFIVSVDEREESKYVSTLDAGTPPGPPFLSPTRIRFEFRADNGAAVKTYSGSFLLGCLRQQIITDELGEFLVTFALPNGEVHIYHFLRELEVTEGATRIDIVSFLMDAMPEAIPRG